MFWQGFVPSPFFGFLGFMYACVSMFFELCSPKLSSGSTPPAILCRPESFSCTAMEGHGLSASLIVPFFQVCSLTQGTLCTSSFIPALIATVLFALYKQRLFRIEAVSWRHVLLGHISTSPIVMGSVKLFPPRRVTFEPCRTLQSLVPVFCVLHSVIQRECGSFMGWRSFVL